MLKLATIKKCREEDKDGRPDSEQQWCLYTKDGSKLLGRHPTKEEAMDQEKAIHANASVNRRIQYKGATYVLADDRWSAEVNTTGSVVPKSIKYKGIKYVLASKPALMLSPQESVSVFSEMLVKEMGKLSSMIEDSTKKDPESGNDYIVMWAQPIKQQMKSVNMLLERVNKTLQKNAPEYPAQSS